MTNRDLLPCWRRLWLFALLLAHCVVPLSSSHGEETSVEGAPATPASPVRITSDRVDSDAKGRWVNFTGDVRATQDDGTIWADSLKVYYRPTEEGSAVSGTIDRMIAEGNVKIVFDGESKTATAQKAVYTTADQVLVLTGGTPKVWSGKNFVQGSRITLFQEEGRTVVEGDDTGRVEATFFTEDEGGLIR